VRHAFTACVGIIKTAAINSKTNHHLLDLFKICGSSPKWGQRHSNKSHDVSIPLLPPILPHFSMPISSFINCGWLGHKQR
jgi:hypothetical protein